jgi:hypothetical protein
MSADHLELIGGTASGTYSASTYIATAGVYYIGIIYHIHVGDMVYCIKIPMFMKLNINLTPTSPVTIGGAN